MARRVALQRIGGAASATRRLRRPLLCSTGGAIAGAFNERSSKFRRLSFYQRSICLDWARRDVPQATISLQLDCCV